MGTNSEHMSQLPSSVQNELIGLYFTYTNKLKPVLAMVESMMMEFPGPVLNEIRAVNDHVSRCFLSGRNETDALIEINKAHGHLTRAILDCYKCLLIVYERKVKDFYHQYRDVCIAVVNDGKFFPKLTELHERAKELTVKARMAESNSFPEKEKAFVEYQKAILAFADVEAHIKQHSDGLAMASQYAKDQTKNNYKFAVISAIIGAILGAIVTFLIG